jgi:hypothetical protein
MAKTSKKLKAWRKKQKRGAIMKPSTFSKIVSKSKKKGLSESRAKKIAGSAYWKTAKAKYKKRKKRKRKKK